MDQQLAGVCDHVVGFMKQFRREDVWTPGGGLFSIDAELRRRLGSNELFLDAVDETRLRLCLLFQSRSIGSPFSAIRNLQRTSSRHGVSGVRTPGTLARVAHICARGPLLFVACSRAPAALLALRRSSPPISALHLARVARTNAHSELHQAN